MSKFKLLTMMYADLREARRTVAGSEMAIRHLETAVREARSDKDVYEVTLTDHAALLRDLRTRVKDLQAERDLQQSGNVYIHINRLNAIVMDLEAARKNLIKLLDKVGHVVVLEEE